MTSSRRPPAPTLPVVSRLSGETYSRTVLRRRLKAELARRARQPGEVDAETLWLVAEARAFTLHLLVHREATLFDLDRCLRDLWMECCGHMSLFSARPKEGRPLHYLAEPDDEEALDAYLEEIHGPLTPAQRLVMEELNRRGILEKSMETPVPSAFQDVPHLTYDYDMGTTTRCTLKLVERLTAPWPDGKKVRLIARNERPIWTCRECGEPATMLCTMWDCTDDQHQPARFCRSHASAHARKAHREEGDDWMMSPLSNSPRDPSCGYQEGPRDEDPYVWP